MTSTRSSQPLTDGKVLLCTSFGDLDLELWPKQAPAAVRNFLQLILDGYYNNVKFERVIKGFMAQTGNPSSEKEVDREEPFKMEIHSRLRFSHRGIVGMAATDNQSNGNSNQFFITLDACEWLNGKHTIFGKVTGDTIFNLMKLNDIEVDSGDHPLDPAPRILNSEVLYNPFDGMEPRKLHKEAPRASLKKKKHKKKNLSLLSFENEEFPEEDTSRGMISCHEASHNDSMLAQESLAVPPAKSTVKTASRERDVTLRPKTHAPMSEKVPIAMKEQSGSKRRAEEELSQLEPTIPEEDECSSEPPKNELKKELEMKRQKYRKQSRKQREEDTLAKLAVFKQSLLGSGISETDQTPDDHEGNVNWKASQLQFSKRPQDFSEMTRRDNPNDYITVDSLANHRGRS